METEHSDVIGGSSAAKRIHCPGSYRLEATVPKEGESEFAARGTALHMAMEFYLMGDDENGSPEQDGQPVSCMIGTEFYGWEITQELVETKLVPAYEALQELIQMVGGEMDYFCEVKVSLEKIIPGAFGTVDILGVGKDGRLVVGDFKFGDGVPVSPEGNFQMGFYGGGALYDEDPEIVDLLGEEAKGWDILFAIIQPRVGYDEPVLQTWETNDEWVEQYLDTLVTAYERMIDENIPLEDTLHAGDHCRWCAAAVVCPAQKQGALAISGESVKVSIPDLDPISMSNWLERCEQLETFINSLKAHAHAEAERGVKIPGWKCVPKRGRRIYTDELAAEEAIRKKLKVADAYQKTLISPAQAEKKLGKDVYDKTVAPHVTMHSSGTTLARDSDPRPDVGNSDNALSAKLKASLPGNGE